MSSVCSRLVGLTFAALLVGSLALAACSTTPTSPGTAPDAAANAKPYGSVIVDAFFGVGVPDPHMGTAFAYHGLTAAIFDSLVGVGDNGDLVPAIAERWEIASDGLTHTFYIRRGVRFHDGSDLTGADVKFSIERILAPDALHNEAPQWRSAVAKVELKDDYTIVLQMKMPQIDLLPGIQNYAGLTAIVPKKYIEEKGADNFRKNPIGSGPWKVVKYEPGSRMELEAVESHWRAVPKYKGLTVLNIAEEAAKVAQLKTGELDVAIIQPDSVATLKAAGLKIVKYDGHSQSFMWPFYDVENPQKWAFGDVRVRKAMALAINRKEMADSIYGGYAEPGTLWYAPKTAFFWDDNLRNQVKPDPYEPEQAKKLLAEAGYASGISTKIFDRGMGTGKDTPLNLAVAGYWRKTGINGEVVPIDYAVLRPMWYPKHKPEIWGNVNGTITAGSGFHFEKMTTPYHSTKSEPKNIKNLRLDELIDKVPTVKDPVEKKRLAQEAVVLAKNEYTTIAILDHSTIVAMGSKVGGITTSRGFGYLAKSWETITHAK